MQEKIDIQELRRAVVNNAKKSKLSIKKYLELFDISEVMYYCHIREDHVPKDYKFIVAYNEIIDLYKKTKL